jgi:hypothetical protein
MIHALLAFAFVLPIPLSGRRGGERTDEAALKQLRMAFEAMDVVVVSDHPRCRESNLYGLYVRGSRQVVVCPRGDQSSTLRHEGWHVVQSLCLGDRPWLSREIVEQHLTRNDLVELQALVAPERWWREAEARVIASLQVNAYLEEVKRACAPNGSDVQTP